MIPYTEEEHRKRLIFTGTVFVMTRCVNGKIEHFILDWDEVNLKELRNEQILR